MQKIMSSSVAIAAIAASALFTGVPASASAASGVRRSDYDARAAPFRAQVKFKITYAGAGTVHTRYHSEPPNPGGNHDTNDAQDSSAQQWSLRFQTALTVPQCKPVKARGANPCTRIATLTGALGRTTASGRAAHVHIDGLFPAQSQSEHCSVRFTTPAGQVLHSMIRLSYDSVQRALKITALNPVVDALIFLPSQCPGQGDSIDGLLDNYFTPGFSFAIGWGPDRWFTSRTIRIPLSVVYRAASIRIPLGDNPSGTPPADCGVPYPAYQRCTTGGSWRGVLTFTRA